MFWILFLLGQLVLSYAEPKSFVYVSEVEEDILPPALRLSGRRSQQRYNPLQDRYSVTEKRVPPVSAPPIAGNVPPSRSSVPKIISDVASKITSLSSGNNSPLSSRTSDYSSATSGKVAPSRFSENSSPQNENSYSNSQNLFNPSSNAQRNPQNVYGSSNPFNNTSSAGGKFNPPPSSSGDRHNYPSSISSPGGNYPSRSSSGNTYSSRSSGDNFLSRSSPGISGRDSSQGNKGNIFPPPRAYGNLGIPSTGNDLRNLNHTSSRQLISRNVNPFNYQNQDFSSIKDQFPSSHTPNIPSQLSLQKASLNKAPNKKEKPLTPCQLLRDREEVKLPLTTFRFFDENQPSSNFKEDRLGQNQNFRNDAGRRGRNTPDREGSLNKNRQTYYSPISFNTGSPQGQRYVQLPNRKSNGPVLVGYQYNRSPANFPSQSRQNNPNLNVPPPNFNRYKPDNALQQNNKPGFNNPDGSERSADSFGNDRRSYNEPGLENIPGNQNSDRRLSDKENNAPSLDNKKIPNYSSQTSGLINQSGRNSQNFNSPSQNNRNKNPNPPQIYYSNKPPGRNLPGSGLSINNNYGRSYSSYRPTVTPERYPSESFEKATFGTAYITIAPLPLDVDGDEIPGKAGVDYPTYHVIPTTSFTCDQVPFNGYYADMEASCQVVHFCQSGGVQNSFLCPNGTIFSQKKFSCQWWYKTNCTESPHYFSLNSDLYKIPVKKLT